MAELLKEQKCFELVICNRISLLFLHLCVKSELEEQRRHKVVTVMSIEFDLLLLVSLQCNLQCLYLPKPLPFSIIYYNKITTILLLNTFIV